MYKREPFLDQWFEMKNSDVCFPLREELKTKRPLPVIFGVADKKAFHYLELQFNFQISLFNFSLHLINTFFSQIFLCFNGHCPRKYNYGITIIFFEECFHLRAIFNYYYLKKMGFQELLEDPKGNHKPFYFYLWCAHQNPLYQLHGRIEHHSKGLIFRKSF